MANHTFLQPFEVFRLLPSNYDRNEWKWLKLYKILSNFMPEAASKTYRMCIFRHMFFPKQFWEGKSQTPSLYQYLFSPADSKVTSRHEYRILTNKRWQPWYIYIYIYIYIYSYLMAVVILALSITIYKIFTIELCMTLLLRPWANIKYKYANQQSIYYFLVYGNRVVYHTFSACKIFAVAMRTILNLTFAMGQTEIWIYKLKSNIWLPIW